MNYDDAAAQLASLLAEAAKDTDRAAAALELAGAVHTEALLASLSAYNQAKRIALATDAPDAPRKATKSGAQLQPMPDTTAELQLDFPLTAEQFQLLQSGSSPVDDFDRWFLDVEGMHLRFYRNASGFCFFDAQVEPAGDAYVVGNVVVNQDEDQYTENNLGVCAAQVKILLASTLGLDEDPYWDEMDAAGD